jgi:hypothetical protein
MFWITAKEDLFHSTVGLSREQFDDLKKRVSQDYKTSYSSGVQKDGVSGRSGLNTQTALFLTLLRLRRKWPFSFLEWFFSKASSTLHEREKHMMNVLFSKMESEISLGTAASRLYNGHWHNNNSLRVVAALDGYLLKLTQPPERQTRLTLQSGKEGTYCLSIFGLMSLESKWIWRSHPMPGSTPD